LNVTTRNRGSGQKNTKQSYNREIYSKISYLAIFFHLFQTQVRDLIATQQRFQYTRISYVTAQPQPMAEYDFYILPIPSMSLGNMRWGIPKW